MQMASADGNMNAEEMLAGASLLSRPADEFGNDQTIEAMWAIKAFEHSEIYFNSAISICNFFNQLQLTNPLHCPHQTMHNTMILCSVDPRLLRLTPHDDMIYKAFREEFPDVDVKTLNEDEMKSPEGKEKWRSFCDKFKGTVEDYNFATLIRLKSDGKYEEDNSIITTRIQFLAIELARNKEGFNDDIRNKFKPSKSKKQS